MKPLFDKAILIGVGLIGSSVGLNLVRKGLAREVIGVGRGASNLREAKSRGAIHRAVPVKKLSSLLPKATESDLIILATPVRTVLAQLGFLPRKPLVIDVGSTKATIIQEATRRRIRFIGTHPIAGMEKSGAKAGDKNLFQGRICLITPLSDSRREDVAKVKNLWKALGAKTLFLEAHKHDELLAMMSHLPHAAAFGLIKAVSELIPLKSASSLGLGSLRDMTRVAESSPEMWRDIFLENRTHVLRGLDRYLKALEKLKVALTQKDSKGLLQFLNKAQAARRSLSLS